MTTNVIQLHQYHVRCLLHDIKSVNERINYFKEEGYEVKRCYVPNYVGVGYSCYMPKLKEYRQIIGRPKHHFSKEVYAIIYKVTE